MKTAGFTHQYAALRRMNGQDAFALFMEMGTGKAQPIDAQVMTPAGWRSIGNLAVGDTIFAASGEPTVVQGVFPQGVKPTFRVSFSDHTSAECCDDHLWAVTTTSARQSWGKGRRDSPFEVLPLREFRTQLRDSATNCTRFIPLSGELHFPTRDLPPIPPYTLGILLGDGCLRRNGCKFTNANRQVVDMVQSELPSTMKLSSRTNEHEMIGAPIYRHALAELGLANKYSYEKFVPEVYKFNSVEVRLAVLQGLLDTDGGVEGGRARYSSTSEQLATDAAEIVRSLGGTARVKRRTNCGYTLAGVRHPTRDAFGVVINLPDHIRPFRLERKAVLYEPHTKYSPKHKVITSVEPSGEKSCVCIAIAHPSHLYITDGHTVTHNTWTILADAERMYGAGKIDGLLVIAPKGVHANWVLREIPKHLSCDHLAATYQSGDTSKKYLRTIASLFAQRELGEPPPLRILAMNIDGVVTKSGWQLAQEFLRSTKAMMVVDESARIKNPAVIRTKRILTLGEKAIMRRICSGLPVTNSPPDIFSQMEFLEHGLLGTTSYRAFVAEYAELLPPGHALMRHVMSRVRQYPGMEPPQLVATDAEGNPRWRNLDKLARLIAPHSYRVLKKECLDLPDKIYTVRSFDLDPAQQRIYDTLEQDLRIEFDDVSEPEPVTALAALSKIRQVTSGFVLRGGRSTLLPLSDNPRLKLLKDILEDLDGQFIVWAHFRAEIEHIAMMMEVAGIPHVQYHGGVSDRDRDVAVNSFQDGTARAFLGQPKSGGIGLTLTGAQTVIYYSNDFNLDTRLQSEDRAHRIGTKSNVVYIDLIANGTRDESIVRALQSKEVMAAKVMGDVLVNKVITHPEVTEYVGEN